MAGLIKKVILLILTLSLLSCSSRFPDCLECKHDCSWNHHLLVEPYCTSHGIKEYYECSNCGIYSFQRPNDGQSINLVNTCSDIDKEDDRYISPLGHDFDSGVVIKEPTIELAGEKQYVCHRCHTIKSEPILPLKYESIDFNQNNYSIVYGDVVFNNTNAISKTSRACILNNSFYFKKGHLSFTLDTSGQEGDNGIIFAANDDAIAVGLLSYYNLFISEDGFVKLAKVSNGNSNLVSSVQVLYYLASECYEIDLFYSSGHICCYVNNQLFANYYDSQPFEGSKIGFTYSNANVSISIFNYDDVSMKSNLMDLRDDNVYRLGSFYNPNQRNCGYFIHKKKIKCGSIVRFLGDASIYKWSLCQIINPEILYSQNWDLFNDGVPCYLDSMWNTDENFVGPEPLTSSISVDSFLCVFLARIDGADLTREEILDLPNHIGVSGCASNDNTENMLIVFSNTSIGCLYDWNNDTKITLRIFKRIAKNTTITFKGDTATLKWSVIEEKQCFDKYVGIDIIEKGIYDSKWNIDIDRSTNFINDREYKVGHDEVYIDLVLSYQDDSTIKSFNLDSLYDLFSINGDEWNRILDNRESISFINHRGYSVKAPENTISAFSMSKKNDYTIVETDVSFTKDGVPVLLHDNTINRTARYPNGKEIDEIIEISDITFDEVRQYDFGIWKDKSFSGEKIPSLEEFISFCSKENLHPYIELKETVPLDSVKKCVDIVSRYGMIRKCTWISFSKERLAAVHFYDKQARLGYLSMYYKKSLIPILLSLKNELNTVFLDELYLDIEYISRLCSATSVPLEVWTVDDYQTLQSLPRYVSGVTSNCLNKIQ